MAPQTLIKLQGDKHREMKRLGKGDMVSDQEATQYSVLGPAHTYKPQMCLEQISLLH